jgi:hypothetical protein
MSTVNANPYAQRIASVLGQTLKATQASLPTVSFVGFQGEGGIATTATTYLIYALIAVFIILLILTLVHYTVMPIFNFGDNPNALISVPMTDWKADWDKSDSRYNDIATKDTLPQSKYSLVFDTKVDNTLPSNSTKNKFILLYKTTAGVAGQADATGSSSSSSSTTTTIPVVCDTTSSGASGSTGSQGGTATQILSVKPLTDFTFLQNNIVPIGGDPSFFVVYDALSSNLQAIVVLRDIASNEYNYKSASVEITPKTAYRIGVVVSDTLVELYVNGKFATSIAYPGKAVAGGNKDVLFSTPGIYSQNVVVKNLFTLNRVATSGEIRQLGGPALS